MNIDKLQVLIDYCKNDSPCDLCQLFDSLTKSCSLYITPNHWDLSFIKQAIEKIEGREHE